MNINFCDQCENILFIFKKDNKLIYKCKNCNNVKENANVSQCIYRNDLNNEQKIQEMNIKMNDFIKHDKTLPSIKNTNIKCPKSCKDSEIIYILNNSDNMKYTYMCKTCDSQWTN
jgi:DNA-directed RNA polymerase subunit M/transcription elongation factor TFIIS